jgi:hypothetical protein
MPAVIKVTGRQVTRRWSLRNLFVCAGCRSPRPPSHAVLLVRAQRAPVAEVRCRRAKTTTASAAHAVIERRRALPTAKQRGIFLFFLFGGWQRAPYRLLGDACHLAVALVAEYRHRRCLWLRSSFCLATSHCNPTPRPGGAGAGSPGQPVDALKWVSALGTVTGAPLRWTVERVAERSHMEPQLRARASQRRGNPLGQADPLVTLV